MEGVILVHVDNKQATQQRDVFLRLLDTCREQDIPIYNLPRWIDAPDILMHYDGTIHHIGYRGGIRVKITKHNFLMQN